MCSHPRIEAEATDYADDTDVEHVRREK
jgi:hypothetical protein